MRLHCLGVNHRSAGVAVREKLAYNQEASLAYWQQLQAQSPVQELVVLSTCNRVEIYAVAEEPLFDVLTQTLQEQMDVDLSKCPDIVYRLVDEQVASHLLRVAAGLDSMVLGEPQILGQVTDAYQQGLEAGACGKVLSRLFQTAIQAGKRVRTETCISCHSTSVSSLAAKLAEQVVPNLGQAQITLLGAGEMAELAVEALRKRGVKNFYVISRTINSACGLAKRWNGQAGTMESLAGVLENTDVLITSSSAPHLLIHWPMVKEAMDSRPQRKLVIIDIAVPRDVDPNVGKISNVLLYDIDGLNEGVAQSMEKRQLEVPAVERILHEEYQVFKDYWSTLKVLPIIVEIRQQADQIRQSELEKTLRHLPQLGEAEQAHIETLTQSIVQKILHEPTIRLRQGAAGPDAEKYAQAAQILFGLSPESDIPDGDGHA